MTAVHSSRPAHWTQEHKELIIGGFVRTLGPEYPTKPKYSGASSRFPRTLRGDHYSVERREQLLPGCVCGQCKLLEEDVPGGLWCVRYPHGMEDELFEARRARDLFAFYEANVSGYVYVLQAGEYYKIGRTKKPDDRIKALKIQLPFSVDVVAVMPCDDEVEAETSLHAEFRHRRTNGEWFKLLKSEGYSFGSAWIRGEMRY